MRLGSFGAFTLALLCCLPARASAQMLSGRVVDQATGAPVSAGFVRLLDATGKRVAEWLTNDAGLYRVTAAAPGRYVVRIERLGYQTFESEPFSLDSAIVRDFRLPSSAIALPEITARSSSKCEKRAPMTPETAVLWGEVRKALDLTSWTADNATIKFDLVDQLRWLRLQDGRKASHFTSDGIADVTGDGNLLMYDYLNVCGATRMNGFCEDSMALFRTDITGASPKALGRFVYGRQQTTIVTRLHHVSFSEPHPQVFRRTLGARTYVADAKRFEIRVFDADGKLEMIVRAPYSQRHYGRAELFPKVKRSAATDSTIAATARAMDELREVAEIPDSLPQFSDMLIDHAGNIWINEYAPPAKRVGPTERWLVFSPDGVLTHIVRAPLDLRGMAGPWLRSYARIGADHAITSRRDADGVESVLVYTLIKGAR